MLDEVNVFGVGLIFCSMCIFMVIVKLILFLLLLNVYGWCVLLNYDVFERFDCWIWVIYIKCMMCLFLNGIWFV